MSRRMRLIALAIFAIVLMPIMAACDPAPTVAIVASDHSERASVKVEIAATNDARELGLMYRKHLDENVGMLFIFPTADPVQFWMKNTPIPLDMIFADSNGRVIGIVANAEPFSEKNVGGFGPTMYVLEVSGGFAARHDIVIGDELKFSGLNPHTDR
ncbi:MAG TPA: DUF192 domain-containing protein [Candidatus Binataceae bacterium]|jgi:uncharacterized protein|nr:DUF192 domain-containing protein [Candidatus Binataceae bacterium]